MKTNYRFEIVRVTHRRYSWRFVVIEEGRRRVLDRSDRDYRSAKRVRRAIARMQNVPVVDLSRMTDRDLFPLPVGTFRIVNGVLPLMVETSSVEFEPSSRRSELVEPADTAPAVLTKDTRRADKAAGKPEVVKTVTTTEAAAKEAAAKEAAAKEAAAKEAAAKEAAAKEAAAKEAAAKAAATKAAGAKAPQADP